VEAVLDNFGAGESSYEFSAAALDELERAYGGKILTSESVSTDIPDIPWNRPLPEGVHRMHESISSTPDLETFLERWREPLSVPVFDWESPGKHS
jgi:hypothetical protein